MDKVYVMDHKCMRQARKLSEIWFSCNSFLSRQPTSPVLIKEQPATKLVWDAEKQISELNSVCVVAMALSFVRVNPWNQIIECPRNQSESYSAMPTAPTFSD